MIPARYTPQSLMDIASDGAIANGSKNGFEGAWLSPSQTRVFDALARFWLHGSAVATLSGYAGVGKTFVTSELVRYWQSTGLNVLVTASTNKAVAVLSAKMPASISAMTIHAALGLKAKEHPNGDVTFEKDSRASSKLLEYDIAVIDEASMLPDDIFAAAIAHRHGCRLLFVGDPAQLAPVQEGDGGVSKAFDASIVPVQEMLTEVVRQAAGNPIIRWAHHLRADIDANRLPVLAELANLLLPDDGPMVTIHYDQTGTAIHEWAANSHSNELDTRVLAFTNAAIDRHNEQIHHLLFPGNDGFAPTEPVMFYGVYAKDKGNKSDGVTVRNSALGTVVDCMDGGLQSPENIETWDLVLKMDSGSVITVPVPKNLSLFNQVIGSMFTRAGAAKQQGYASSRPSERSQLLDLSRNLSARAWETKKHFAIVKHAYATTIHKSQGSTFETVLLDWNDLPRYPKKPSDVARLVYVAVTRASKHLAVIVRG